jgi:1,4-alpha-glucan branching enzyme
MHFDQQTVKMITIPQYLDQYSKIQITQPSMSSWGLKGYSECWLEGSNDWIYRHLHEDSERMVELAQHHSDGGSDLRRRALNQAARELMLAQSSDWAFIMKTGTMVEYAVERTKVHVLNFNHLYDQIKKNEIDDGWLNQIEKRHNLFPDIDYRVYA